MGSQRVTSEVLNSAKEKRLTGSEKGGKEQSKEETTVCLRTSLGSISRKSDSGLSGEGKRESEEITLAARKIFYCGCRVSLLKSIGEKDNNRRKKDKKPIESGWGSKNFLT